MIEPVLKRCPFCGSKVRIFDNKKDFTADETHYGIKCTNKRCGLFATFYPRNNSKSRMVDAWNKRVGIDA